MYCVCTVGAEVMTNDDGMYRNVQRASRMICLDYFFILFLFIHLITNGQNTH